MNCENEEDVSELKAECERLARALAEKEILLKEVHHRVKNNLTVIASLLLLESDRWKDPNVRSALRESQNRIESMAFIHDQLCAKEDVQEVDLAQHASLLLTNLFQSYGVDPARISGHVAIPQKLPMPVDRAIPAGLILNELISNALKHAFPGKRPGTIHVEGERTGGHITLTVRDNGSGIPDNPEPNRTASLGLKIVELLTRQLKGILALDRRDGTTFRISFPEA